MSDISFDISSMMLSKDRQKVLKPNSEGIYEKVPLMVLGKVSRNNKEYEVSSMVAAITDTNSCFAKKLRAGQLEGEWCHPLIFKEEELSRIATIDRSRVSHMIHRVYTGETTEQGHTIVYGDIEPCGPFGRYLTESFQNPRKNTAFSLRSLVSKVGEVNGVIKQTVTALITVDAVDCPGYAEASKVYDPAVESLNIPFDANKNIDLVMDIVGAESINDQQILDILEADKVTVINRLDGWLDVQHQSIITKSGPKSIFHNVFGRTE